MRLAAIGYGRRMHAMMRQFAECDRRCRLVAIADPALEAVKQRVAALPQPQRDPHPTLYEDVDAMLAAERSRLDGILIGTRCSLHAEMMVKTLPLGIPIFLEKPVATTPEDYRRLERMAERYDTPVVVSFPLRYTPLVQTVKTLLDSGKIGRTSHVQAVNNVTYGGTYFHGWYRDEGETGGLFLQKATHDFDYIQYLVGEKPIHVCAVTSKQVFRGGKPAGLRCSACDEAACDERVTPKGIEPERPNDYCCYAEDTGNEDSGSALVVFESGMHLSYSQNFIVRGRAHARGARLIGEKGTIEFDFYTGKLRVYMHYRPEDETYDIPNDGPHFGGDERLAQNFLDVVSGADVPKATLRDGLRSAWLCLQAKASAETLRFQRVADAGGKTGNF